METTQQEHLLTDLESNLVRANAGKRFINYIVDVIAFYLFVFVLSLVLYFLNVSLFSTNEKAPFVDTIISMLIYALFMGLMETIFRGKSLGKLITGTKAVNLDGTSISAATAFARGFSRIVPLEPFSALGAGPNPWHDSWNKTIVIDIKASTIIEN